MSDRDEHGRFKEGNGFGQGRPRVPQDIQDARKLNRAEVERVVNEMLRWSLKDLKSFCENSDNKVFECLVASILAKAIHQGDQFRMDYVLSILSLKPKENSSDAPNIHGQVVNLIKQIEGKNESKFSVQSKDDDADTK